MNLSNITPVILTWNEAPNIGRCLDQLGWADDIVVLDSGSDDATREICEGYDNVRYSVRAFDSHSCQWNHATSLAKTDWILALDADFIVPETIPGELLELPEEGEVRGYVSRFRYCVNGKPLRASLYPPKTVLFRKERCTYVQDGHTQLLTGDSPTAVLEHVIDHDDRKPLSRWLEAQKKYTLLEIEKLHHSDPRELTLPDKLRYRIWPAPPAVLFYTLIVRGTLFDGWPGLFYAFQRCYAELLVSLHLLDCKLRSISKNSQANESKENHALRPASSSRVDRGDRSALHD